MFFGHFIIASIQKIFRTLERSNKQVVKIISHFGVNFAGGGGCFAESARSLRSKIWGFLFILSGLVSLFS